MCLVKHQIPGGHQDNYNKCLSVTTSTKTGHLASMLYEENLLSTIVRFLLLIE